MKKFFLLLFLATSVVAQHAPNGDYFAWGRVGYWPLCGNSSDYSGNSYNGSATNAVYTNGLSNCGAYFKGTATSTINMGTTSALMGTYSSNAFSLFCWMNAGPTVPGAEVVVGKELNSGTFQGYYLILEAPTVVLAVIQSSSAAYAGVSFTGIPTNLWMFVGFTWNGNSNATGLVMFTNGLRAATSVVQNNFTYYASLSAPFCISGRDNANGIPFLGDIAQVFLYNRVLTDEEIFELYEATRN